MIHIFVTSFALATIASVICWALVFATVPTLRCSHPQDFAAAGSPKMISWHLLRVDFLIYLFSHKFSALQDARLVARLKALRAAWAVGLVALVVMLVSISLHFGA